MLQKKVKVLVLLIFLIGLIISCGSKKEEGKKTVESKTERTEITVMVPDWGMPSEEMLAEFTKETGIKVKALPTAWDEIKSKIAVAAAGKKTPADVIEVDWSWTGEFVSAGWLEALDVDDATIKDIPGLSYYKVKDKYYAIPYANGVRLTYVNKEMFGKAGIKEGEYPKTWKEMEVAMDKLKKSGAVEYPFLFPMSAEEKTSTSFYALAYTRNGKIFNNDDTLNVESALSTLKMLKEYLDKGYINPADVTQPGMDVFRGINNANGALLIGPMFHITSTENPETSKVVGKVTTIPAMGLDAPATGTITFIEAVGISPYSENKEAAKKYIEWYSRPDTQRKLNKAVHVIPTRTSVLEEMIKDGTIKNPGALVEEAKKVTTPFPNGVPKYYTKMSTEIFNLINQMGQGKITPEEATKLMDEKIKQLIQENK